MKCLCGQSDIEKVAPPNLAWLVSDTGFAGPSDVLFGRCKDCGVVRQLTSRFDTEAEYNEFYSSKYPPNKSTYRVKDYNHDKELAKKRADAYGLSGKLRILDIGSGSGAFVDECRERGLEAYGCEVATYSYEKDSKFIYRLPFEHIRFPTDHFGLVTCHDVLEHSLNPVSMLEEAFRVTGQQGRFILDFPRFFHKSGQHHWKDGEHLWLFDEEQLDNLLRNVGFEIDKVDSPIESKLVFHCRKPKQNRARIILPPGMGDCYWPLVKMEALIEREGIGLPDVHVLCKVDSKFKSHLRSFPFLEMFPFICSTWEVVPFRKDDKTWIEAYVKDGRTVFKDVLGCDYFVSYNGVLEAGRSLEEVDQDLRCNWYPKRFVSLEESNYQAKCESELGRYFVLHFPMVGTFKHWINQFSPEKIVNSINSISRKTGLVPVFVGAEWDNHDQGQVGLISKVKGSVSLLGQTSVAQMFGLIKGSEMIIGFPSGLTMMAAYLRKRTLAVWNDWHRYGFHWHTSPPDVKGRSYFVENTKGLSDKDLAAKAVKLSTGDLIQSESRLFLQEKADAVVQLSRYGIRQSERILHIGSGRGIFVNECKKRGLEAYGCEDMEFDNCQARDFVYRDKFTDINFPTDHFDRVVIADTFGHLIDPAGFLENVFRVVRQKGRLHLTHSTAKAMNVWFWRVSELESKLKRVGFKLVSSKRSGDFETHLTLEKPTQDRPKILVPPGIGDCYWSLVKLRAFLQREGLGLPDVSIVHPKSRKFKAHRRSVPFLEMFPRLHSTGKVVDNGPKARHQDVWREAYHQSGRTIFKDVLGFDFFICYNGVMRYGMSLTEADPDLECDWSPPSFRSLEQREFRSKSIEKYGKYFLAYFAFVGTNRHLFKHFSLQDCIGWINRVSRGTGWTPVFVGAEWDKSDNYLSRMIHQVPNCVDLIGKTTIQQLFGLMRGSQAVLGIPSGLTIMAAVDGLPTVMIWNDWFNRDFAWNSCPPGVAGKTYLAEYADSTSLGALTEKTLALLGGKEFKVERSPRPRVSQPKAPWPKAPWPKKKVVDKPLPQVTVVCVLKSGGDFSERYVYNLLAMLKRNTTVPFKFVCLTDLDVIEGVDIIPLKDGLKGWWSKIELFRPGLFDTDRVVYFDLDTLIVGNIDELLLLRDGFYALRPWNRKNLARGMLASGVMAWDNGKCDFIYTGYVGQEPPAGDQEYINQALASNDVQFKALQDSMSGGIHSYKRSCKNSAPPDTRIVCFHGKPRIHECRDRWVKEVWH